MAVGIGITPSGYSLAGSGGGGGGGTSALTLEFAGVAGENIAAGQVVRFDRTASPGQILLARANSEEAGQALGVAKTSAISGAAVTVTLGGSAPCQFGGAPAASANGDPVYLDPTTAGNGTLTAPSASGQAVTLIGFLFGADGADTTPNVVLRPSLLYMLA